MNWLTVLKRGLVSVPADRRARPAAAPRDEDAELPLTGEGFPPDVTRARVIVDGPRDPTTIDAYAVEIIQRMFPRDAQRLRIVRGGGPPPSLDSFEHGVSNVPPDAKLKAWQKVQETERRLAVATWAMARTDPHSGEHRVLAEDLVGAYFYAAEATVQVLKEETEIVRGKGWFDPWIAGHPQNTIVLRGIRTIRTLAVHVEDIRSSSGISISVVRGHGGTVTRFWRLPWLTPDALRALKGPKLKETDLDAWKKLRAEWPAGYLMERALTDLRQIVLDAENLA